MFKLPGGFREKIEEAYKKRPVQSAITGKRLSFSVPRFLESLEKFIQKDLKNLDDELYLIYTHKLESTNRGLGKDMYYRLFALSESNWKPTRDLVDLLYYYVFSKSYEETVAENLQKVVEENIRPDEYLQDFFKLKTQRSFKDIDTINLEKREKMIERLLLYLQKKWSD